MTSKSVEELIRENEQLRQELFEKQGRLLSLETQVYESLRVSCHATSVMSVDDLALENQQLHNDTRVPDTSYSCPNICARPLLRSALPGHHPAQCDCLRTHRQPLKSVWYRVVAHTPPDLYPRQPRQPSVGTYYFN